MKRTFVAVALLALLGAIPAAAQVDLSNYVAVGDSLTAGYSSNSLEQCYQENGWPAVLARQAGTADFELPLISPPGIPNILQLTGLTLISGQPSPAIAPAPGAPGIPINATLPRPYNNLGIPGATVYDLLFTTGDISNLLAGNTDNVMYDLILRTPQVINPASGQLMDFPAVAQAIALQPTFITLWAGNDDELGAVLTGSAISGVTMTPVDLFAQLYPQLLGALASTGADMVVINLPDPTKSAFATTVPPFVNIPGLGVVPLVGSNGPLTADCLVTLPASALIAQGYGLPLPGYPPLPEDLNLATAQPGYVLRPAEITAIRQQVDAFNQIIADAAGQFGAPVFDADAGITTVSTQGYTFGGININLDFLTGGYISFDGLHPQQIGYSIIAMQMVDFINQQFGADIEPIDIYPILFNNPCVDIVSKAAAKAKANQVVFTREAHQRLIDTLLPHLKQRLLELRTQTQQAPPTRQPRGARRVPQ